MRNATNTPRYFPILQTDRLILRQLTMEDIDFVYKHFHDSNVTQYLLDEPPVMDYAQAQAIIEFYSAPEVKLHNRWGIVRKADNRLIGTCGYHKWITAYFRAEIGYDLSPDCWGQRYMSEAIRAVIQNGFERMRLNRIDALVYINNDRSIKLLQKLGFKQEGLLRDYFYLNGIFYDHYLFSILRREWEQ